MLLTILKAPLKIAALLLAFLMNLLASLFLAGAVAGWIVHAEAMLVWRTADACIFSSVLPSVEGGLLEGVG